MINNTLCKITRFKLATLLTPVAAPTLSSKLTLSINDRLSNEREKDRKREKEREREGEKS